MESEVLEVPAGKIAAVITHLQMFARPAARPVPNVAAELVAHETPDLNWYRDLFERVGSIEWLWFSRLCMADADLAAILHHAAVHVYSVRSNGRDVGLLELDFRTHGACEIGFFGLTSDMRGTGAGRWLMEQALDRAWAAPISRLHVHTCTLDSPQALSFYLRSGFTAYRRQLEIADDPRKSGMLPDGCAPHVPMI